LGKLWFLGNGEIAVGGLSLLGKGNSLFFRGCGFLEMRERLEYGCLQEENLKNHDLFSLMTFVNQPGFLELISYNRSSLNLAAHFGFTLK